MDDTEIKFVEIEYCPDDVAYLLWPDVDGRLDRVDKIINIGEVED